MLGGLSRSESSISVWCTEKINFSGKQYLMFP